MKINWSIKLGISALILMVFGWIFAPDLMDDADTFCNVLFVVIMLFIVIGLFAYRSDVIYEAAAEKEFFDVVADKIHERIITMPEMKNNAESNLTYDQQAHLRMLRNNPHFKIDTKV